MAPRLPRVSIVILSHRRELVGEAEASARGQTYANIEVVTKYCPLGWPTKLNEAVSATRGEWVVLLCDDDLLAPTYVEDLMWFAHAADVLYTDRLHFHTGQPRDDWKLVRMHSDVPLLKAREAVRCTIRPWTFVFGSPLPMTIMVRRALWNRLAGYDGTVHHADTEFLYRAIRAGARMGYVPKPLFWYREHAGQVSRVGDTMTKAMYDFHRKHFTEFGLAFHRAVRRGAELDVRVVPAVERLAYRTTHFTSLTTMGHMATEIRKLSSIAKTAIALQQNNAQQAVNATIRLALDDANLKIEDGWRLNDELDAVREVADDVPNETPVPTLVLTPTDAAEPVLQVMS